LGSGHICFVSRLSVRPICCGLAAVIAQVPRLRMRRPFWSHMKRVGGQSINHGGLIVRRVEFER
jgi:hypothetical protein